MEIIQSSAYVLLSALACAVAYRLRGSELWAQATGRGVGTARIMWSFVCLAAVAAQAEAWWLPLAVFAVSFPVSTIHQMGSIDMGNRDGTFLRDFALQTFRGGVGGVGIAAAYWLAGEAWLSPLLGGLAAGPAYALAWRTPVHADHMGKDDPPEAGEILFGAAMGAGLALGLVL